MRQNPVGEPAATDCGKEFRNVSVVQLL